MHSCKTVDDNMEHNDVSYYILWSICNGNNGIGSMDMHLVLYVCLLWLKEWINNMVISIGNILWC